MVRIFALRPTRDIAILLIHAPEHYTTTLYDALAHSPRRNINPICVCDDDDAYCTVLRVSHCVLAMHVCLHAMASQSTDTCTRLACVCHGSGLVCLLGSALMCRQICICCVYIYVDSSSSASCASLRARSAKLGSLFDICVTCKQENMNSCRSPEHIINEMFLLCIYYTICIYEYVF